MTTLKSWFRKLTGSGDTVSRQPRVQEGNPVDDLMKPLSSRILIGYLLVTTVLTGYLFYTLAAAKPMVDTSSPPPTNCNEAVKDAAAKDAVAKDAAAKAAAAKDAATKAAALADTAAKDAAEKDVAAKDAAAKATAAKAAGANDAPALEAVAKDATAKADAAKDAAAKADAAKNAADKDAAAQDATAKADAAKAAATSVRSYPAQVNAGSVAEVLLVGCQFTKEVKLKVNGIERIPLSVEATQIRVGLSSTETANVGGVFLTLSNGSTDIGSTVLKVVTPSVDWNLFLLGNSNISQEAQLLLMVLFIGAFGSCVYALKSLADFQGDKKLYESWFNYYSIQPFEGSGIALLMYLVIRGGFLTGTGADVKAVNVFGMCAIAGLAGAFSDTAFLKLREVFQTLFKPKDDRGGKISPLNITTTTLPDGTVGTPYDQTLQASDGTAPLKWSVKPALPTPLTLDATTGKIGGIPTAPTAKTTYKFTVTDSATPALSASADLTLEIKAASGTAASGTAVTAAPDDAGDDIDGCDVPVQNATSDDDLPATQGGVA
jgi:hypothetical protein